MKAATRIQQRILDFILKRQNTDCVTPTFQEIADHFGFRSPNAVTKHVRLLRQKGLLDASSGKTRSLRVISSLNKLRSRIVDIPLYGSIPAGTPQDREQDAEGCVSVDIQTIGYTPKQSIQHLFAVRVTGDSMTGRHILDGDFVILERGPDPRNGQIVAAYVDGKNTLKTFMQTGRKVYLKAENPKYPAIIPAEELMIQGVFKALIRQSND
jgi:repressor LexA